MGRVAIARQNPPPVVVKTFRVGTKSSFGPSILDFLSRFIEGGDLARGKLLRHNDY